MLSPCILYTTVCLCSCVQFLFNFRCFKSSICLHVTTSRTILSLKQVHNRSSAYSSESSVRKTGSYIYEDFLATDGTDVKVYTVGPDYAHAEARKSPVSHMITM